MHILDVLLCSTAECFYELSPQGESKYKQGEKIGHVQYINILTWLWGFQDNILYLVMLFLYPSLFCEFWEKRNLKYLQFWPENLGAMLEYWYIERGLLSAILNNDTP